MVEGRHCETACTQQLDPPALLLHRHSSCDVQYAETYQQAPKRKSLAGFTTSGLKDMWERKTTKSNTSASALTQGRLGGSEGFS